jgi:hypothetical protein
MPDRSASLQRNNLLAPKTHDAPFLKDDQLPPRLKPALVPAFNNTSRQHNGPDKPPETTSELPANDKEGGCRPSLRKHQFHFWLGKKDFLFLQNQAEEEGESVARIIRRLVREFRIHAENGTSFPR